MQKGAIVINNNLQLPCNKYSIIYADPPWQYKNYNYAKTSADISNDKAGEKPARRKTKGSCPTLIGAG